MSTPQNRLHYVLASIAAVITMTLAIQLDARLHPDFSKHQASVLSGVKASPQVIVTPLQDSLLRLNSAQQ